jgi:hypothetical protein
MGRGKLWKKKSIPYSHQISKELEPNKLRAKLKIKRLADVQGRSESCLFVPLELSFPPPTKKTLQAKYPRFALLSAITNLAAERPTLTNDCHCH